MFTKDILTIIDALTFSEILVVIAVSCAVLLSLFLLSIIFLKYHMAVYGMNDQGLDILNANMEKWKKSRALHSEQRS